MRRGGAGADHRRGVSPEQCAPPHGPAVGGAHHPGGDVVLVGSPCWDGFPNGWWHPVSGGLEVDGHGKNSLGASDDLTVVGIEGPGAQAIEVSRSHDPSLVATARTLTEAFESQPGLRDLSPHLLAIGRTPP